jgi:predicted MPP superfamily phosphohydrolase
MAKKYPWGLRRIGLLTLYTNVGLGTIRVAARLNCPPEITLITLRTANRG